MNKPNLKKDKALLSKLLSPIPPKSLINLLDELLTEEEILNIAQRIKIAKLILKGKTYEEIFIL